MVNNKVVGTYCPFCKCDYPPENMANLGEGGSPVVNTALVLVCKECGSNTQRKVFRR